MSEVGTAERATSQQHRREDGPRLSFGRVLRAELIKLSSLGSTYWSLLVGVGGMVILGLAVASGAELSRDIAFDPEIAQATQHSALTVGVAFGQIVVAVISILLVTGEFTSGSIRVTLAAVPSRLPVVFAKCVAAATYALVLGLGALIATSAVTAPMFVTKGYRLHLLDPLVLLPLGYSVGYLVMIAIINVAIGALMRSTVSALVVMLALMQVIPVMLGAAAEALKEVWISNLASFLPTNTAGGGFYAYLGPRDVVDQFDGLGHLQLAPWQGFAVVCIWMTVLLVAACVSFRRRDL